MASGKVSAAAYAKAANAVKNAISSGKISYNSGSNSFTINSGDNAGKAVAGNTATASCFGGSSSGSGGSGGGNSFIDPSVLQSNLKNGGNTAATAAKYGIYDNAQVDALNKSQTTYTPTYKSDGKGGVTKVSNTAANPNDMMFGDKITNYSKQGGNASSYLEGRDSDLAVTAKSKGITTREGLNDWLSSNSSYASADDASKQKTLDRIMNNMNGLASSVEFNNDKTDELNYNPYEEDEEDITDLLGDELDINDDTINGEEEYDSDYWKDYREDYYNNNSNEDTINDNRQKDNSLTDTANEVLATDITPQVNIINAAGAHDAYKEDEEKVYRPEEDEGYVSVGSTPEVDDKQEENKVEYTQGNFNDVQQSTSDVLDDLIGGGVDNAADNAELPEEGGEATETPAEEVEGDIPTNGEEASEEAAAIEEESMAQNGYLPGDEPEGELTPTQIASDVEYAIDRIVANYDALLANGNKPTMADVDAVFNEMMASLKSWANKHGIPENSPEYRKVVNAARNHRIMKIAK